MHDLRAIRDNPQAFDEGLARRGLEPVAGIILKLDDERRANETIHQTQLAERNAAAKEGGAAKGAGRDARYKQLRAKAQLRADIGEAAAEVSGKGAVEIREILATLPNIPAEDVPEGGDDSATVQVKKWSEQEPAA